MHTDEKKLKVKTHCITLHFCQLFSSFDEAVQREVARRLAEQGQQPGQPPIVQHRGQPSIMQQPGQPSIVQQPGQPSIVQQPGQPSVMPPPLFPPQSLQAQGLGGILTAASGLYILGPDGNPILRDRPVQAAPPSPSVVSADAAYLQNLHLPPSAAPTKLSNVSSAVQQSDSEFLEKFTTPSKNIAPDRPPLGKPPQIPRVTPKNRNPRKMLVKDEPKTPKILRSKGGTPSGTPKTTPKSTPKTTPKTTPTQQKKGKNGKGDVKPVIEQPKVKPVVQQPKPKPKPLQKPTVRATPPRRTQVKPTPTPPKPVLPVIDPDTSSDSDFDTSEPEFDLSKDEQFLAQEIGMAPLTRSQKKAGKKPKVPPPGKRMPTYVPGPAPQKTQPKGGLRSKSSTPPPKQQKKPQAPATPAKIVATPEQSQTRKKREMVKQRSPTPPIPPEKELKTVKVVAEQFEDYFKVR